MRIRPRVKEDQGLVIRGNDSESDHSKVGMHAVGFGCLLCQKWVDGHLWVVFLRFHFCR